MASLAFDLKFTYWVAPKDVPQYVAALWDLFSLDENKKQLPDWTLSIPKVRDAANGTGSDQAKLMTFAVRFTHKTVTYDDLKQARTIFESACHICVAIVQKLPSSCEPMPGLLRFDHLLRYIFALQNNPTKTSGLWADWGLISVYYQGTSPNDGGPVAMLEKFMEYQERMPLRYNNKPENGLSKSGLVNMKAMTADAGKNYKLVKKDSSRLMRSPTAVDVKGLNTAVRAAVQRHCDVVDCIQATNVANGRLAELVAEFAETMASFMALTKDMPKRPTPWWKIFGRDYVEQANRSMTKLHARAKALEREAKVVGILLIHLDSAVRQHGTSSRLVVLDSHLQVQWRKLVDILDQPGADESQLNSLYGVNIRAMAQDYNRQDQLLRSMRRFKKGERAVCLEERLIVKLASQLEAEAKKLSRDYAETVKKFEEGQVREYGSKLATKGKDMFWDSDSESSDETLCEKKQ